MSHLLDEFSSGKLDKDGVSSLILESISESMRQMEQKRMYIIQKLVVNEDNSEEEELITDVLNVNEKKKKVPLLVHLGIQHIEALKMYYYILDECYIESESLIMSRIQPGSVVIKQQVALQKIIDVG